MQGTAELGGPGECYRYRLTREWGGKQRVCFVMLNPSRADRSDPDPTLTRCISFAQRWGFGSLVIVNLFALRSPDPKSLRTARRDGMDPVGARNDFHIVKAVREANKVVAAWGNHGTLEGRGKEVLGLIRKNSRKTVWCFGRTALAQPKHPLYLPSGSSLEPISGK